jgi:hypothetical protein
MIRLIGTSANLDKDYSSRKDQYLNGLISLLKYYRINPYIIETVKKTDYLNESFIGHSTYSTNKGINELLNLKTFLSNQDFNDEDDVIKVTLRYEVISSYFLDMVKNDDYEVYCKNSSDIYGANDPNIHSFLISMKYRCWKEFLNNIDTLVDKDYPIEIMFANFVKKCRTKYLDKLDILANPANHRKIYQV